MYVYGSIFVFLSQPNSLDSTRGNEDDRSLQDALVFQESGGLVVMEAESVVVDEPWKFETSLPGFTGSGYLRFDGNDVMGRGNALGFLSYRFQIYSAGVYTMVFRSNKNNTLATWANDCYTLMNDITNGGFVGPPEYTKTFMQGSPNIWRYKLQYDLEDGSRPEPTFSFAAGAYELEIAGRSRDFFIDRIVLYQAAAVSLNVVEDTSVPESPTSGTPVASPVATPVAAPVAAPVASPVAVPVASPVAAPPTPPANFPAPQVLINAGSPDEDLSLLSGVIWTSEFPANITGVPAPYDPAFFQTHRSGDNFTYAVPGFVPFQEANVVLGFAENWLPNCRDTRNRNMNVVVNGQAFLTGLNVFGEVGCNAALLESGVFAADANGAFILQFTSSNPNQNPFVSLIAIGPTSGTTEGEPPTSGGAPPPSPTVPSTVITSLILVRASDREMIQVLQTGDVIDLEALNTTELSIVAIATTAVSRVRFSYDGLTQQEGSRPFSMDGKAGQCCFNAVPYLATDGIKTVTVDAFGDTSGSPIGTLTITFDVVAGSMADSFTEFSEEGFFYPDSLFPGFDVLIDAGSATEEESLISGEGRITQYSSNASIAAGMVDRVSCLTRSLAYS